ncbi:MAG TPA: carbohydrate-binding protein [Pseudobacteroides sp.]|uniref:carbohydrate-binding protein n=1 Tax=Pseudobacteroides sp. TaxID=1968840 RepID=UPI002F9563E7
MKNRRTTIFMLVIIYVVSISIINLSPNLPEKVYADSVTDTATPTPAISDTVFTADREISSGQGITRYYETGTWTDLNEGNRGGCRISSKIGSSASWTFIAQESGYYDVVISYPIKDTYTTIAKYIINVGDLQDSFYANQTIGVAKCNYYLNKGAAVKVYLVVTSPNNHVADKIDFIKKVEPTATPTIKPIVTPSPCARAIPAFVEAEESMFKGDFTREDKYIYAGSKGGSILIPNVTFGCGHIPNDIFSAGISLEPNAAGGEIEVRKDSETGTLLGTLQLKNTGRNVSCFYEQNTSLIPTNGANCNIYLVFKGDCSGRYDWFKITGFSNYKQIQGLPVKLTPISSSTGYVYGMNEKVLDIYGSPGKIGFQLTDMSGNPIAGQIINIDKAGDFWGINTLAVTDSLGVAMFDYTPQSMHYDRSDIIKAWYLGDNRYNAVYTEIGASVKSPPTPTPTRSTTTPTEPTTTPSPTPTDITVIDNSSTGYSQKGDWQEEEGGTNGSYKSTTKIGSTAMWRFKVPETGYYEIKALIPDDFVNAFTKYTVFYNERYIDSFYNAGTKGDFILKKDYGKFISYAKDSWITVIVRSVSEGKCIADAISFKKLPYVPTPHPTAPGGFSSPVKVEAEDCSLVGAVQEGGYISSCDDGDYAVIKGVLLSGYSGYDSMDIFSVNAASEGDDAKNGKLEIRMDSLDGPVLGTIELKNTGVSGFCEQAFLLNRINADFKPKDVYIIFKGEGRFNFDWFKLSRLNKPEPAQSEVLDTNSDKKICGYIKPGFDTTNSLIYEGFKVEITGTEVYTLTDREGYFEIGVNSSEPVSLKISKDGYLLREVSNVAITDNVTQITTQDKPLEIWPGDIVKDNSINMSDIVAMAKVFNSVKGDAAYIDGCDINQDGAINMADIVIIARYFGMTLHNYK